MGIQSRKLLRWTAVLGILLPLSSHADTFNFDNINLGDFDALVNEFSANSQYTTVTPPSSLGGLWGFELGVTGGMTKAPDTLALVKRSSPATTLKDNLYHAGAVLRLGLPFGITAEALLLLDLIDISIKHFQKIGHQIGTKGLAFVINVGIRSS